MVFIVNANMSIEKILSLLPANLLEELAVETKVDYFSKKLQGEVVFKLLLHCIFSEKDNSLRRMESAYETLFFSFINSHNHKNSISFSSVSERLSVINPDYFEKIYQSCVKLYKDDLGKGGDNLLRFDSTIVALSMKLLKTGFHLKGGDAAKYRQLKFTVGYGEIPEIVHLYTDQSHNSENVALKETIVEQSKQDKSGIKVFDRGITARKTYDTFTEDGITFISRLSPQAKYDKRESFDQATNFPLETDTLKITSDEWCQLYSEGCVKSKHPVRRIEAVRLADNSPVTFVTNSRELTAVEVTILYKRRWDIEVFFKFIKQSLNFSHLLNRSENGIKVVLYVTMIASILLLAYKKLNNLKGYKIAKQKFANELEFEIVKQLITLCGGNPDKLNVILSLNNSS